MKYWVLSSESPYVLSRVGDLGIWYVSVVYLLNCYQLLVQGEYLVRHHREVDKRRVTQFFRLCGLMLILIMVSRNFHIPTPFEISHAYLTSPVISFSAVLLLFFMLVEVYLDFYRIS